MRRSTAAPLLLALALTACQPGGEAADEAAEEEPRQAVLGPVDGHDLPGVDLERVQVGHVAPDFTLASLAGPPVTLSGFQGEKNVVLVFYRGHW